MHPVQREGASVILRELRADDIEGLAAILCDDRVTGWLSFDSRSRSEATGMLEGIVERSTKDPRDEYYLAVTQPPDDDVLGICRLAFGGVRAAKLGFAIQADRWGQGLATDAAATMIAFGFGPLDLHRITATIEPTNQASLAIAKKLGMTYEGRLRDHDFAHGNWRDSLLFSVLAHEHEPRR
jgi:[ribosomal protein S5]-alanine N-acetyltransferase